MNSPSSFEVYVRQFRGSFLSLYYSLESGKESLLPISLQHITLQYLSFLRQSSCSPAEHCQQLRLIVHLVYLKTVELLPTPPKETLPPSEDESQHWHQEYLRIQSVQGSIDSMIRLHAQRYSRSQQLLPFTTENQLFVSLYKIAQSYQRLCLRSTARQHMETKHFHIPKNTINTRQLIFQIKNEFKQQPTPSIYDFLHVSQHRSEFCFRFFLLLEWLKESIISLDTSSRSLSYQKSLPNLTTVASL